MRKGKREEGTELGMDEASETGEGGSDRRREGSTERGRGTGRSVGERELGREGTSKGYPDECTGQYSVYISSM